MGQYFLDRHYIATFSMHQNRIFSIFLSAAVGNIFYWAFRIDNLMVLVLIGYSEIGAHVWVISVI